MPHDPHAQFDQHVLEIIELSPVGGVPHTPAHREGLGRLVAAHQVYISADFADGFATVRALAQLPSFYAPQLEAFLAGDTAADTLESDTSIFDRYVASLPPELHAAAEQFRAIAVAKREHHRTKADAEVVHDPVHSLFLFPGTGPNPGLPGNYLFGSVIEASSDPADDAWVLVVHDRHDGVATCEVPDHAAALDKFQELLASAPCMLGELTELDFHGHLTEIPH